MAQRIVVTGTRGIPDVSGGVETHVELLFPLMVSDNTEVFVCCRSCYIPPAKRIPEYRGCHLVYIDTPKRKSLEAIVHTYKSILYAKKVHADVLHVHAIGPALLIPFARLLGLHVVFTHHGPDYERKKWGKLARFMLRMGEWAGCRFSNDVIVISEVIKSLVETKYKRNDAVLIHNGVQLPESPKHTDYLSSLGIESGKYILSVARFVEEKGLHDLIHAYSKLGPSAWKLVIAGDADHETDYSRLLKEKARKVPGVVLTGYIKGNTLSEIYSSAALFVLPSYHEGLPIALLEAMSFQLDVLVSDIPPHIEISLPEDCYFEMGSISDLQTRLANRLRDGIVVRDFRSLLNLKYNWTKIADQTLKVYRK